MRQVSPLPVWSTIISVLTRDTLVLLYFAVAVTEALIYSLPMLDPGTLTAFGASPFQIPFVATAAMAGFYGLGRIETARSGSSGATWRTPASSGWPRSWPSRSSRLRSGAWSTTCGWTRRTCSSTRRSSSPPSASRTSPAWARAATSSASCAGPGSRCSSSAGISTSWSPRPSRTRRCSARCCRRRCCSSRSTRPSSSGSCGGRIRPGRPAGGCSTARSPSRACRCS